MKKKKASAEEEPKIAHSVSAALIEVGIEAPAGTTERVLHVDYTLRTSGVEPDVITLVLDEDAGQLEHIWCSAATDAHLSRRQQLPTIDMHRASQASFHGATISVRIRWNHDARRPLKGSPVVVLPSALPQLLTMNGPYTAHEFRDPVDERDEPRIRFRSETFVTAGSVRDRAGELLMAAVPIDEGWDVNVWHADDALVLAGAGLGSLAPTRRAAIRDRLLEIHTMLGTEFGRGDCVRSLAIYDDGADAFTRQPGQFSALGLKYMEANHAGRFLGERQMARHLASTWWAFGVRPAGQPGPAMALGLTHYAVMRWFAVTGKKEELDDEVAFARKLITRLESEGRELDPVAWRGMHIALALFDASRKGPELANELRQWCADDWGKSIPVPTLTRRLARIGVWLPQ